MQKIHFPPAFPAMLLLFLPLFATACDNAGIFAIIAVTDKIEKGALSEGISATTVVLAKAMSPDYAFFSSGSGLWAKKITTPTSKWSGVALITSDDKHWDGIQAMVASDTHVYFAFYKIDQDNHYTVSLYRMDSFTGLVAVFTPLNNSWPSTSSHYQTIKLFCPDKAGSVYVNVMEHQGKYGSLDESGQKFTGSKLYMIAHKKPSSLTLSKDGIANQKELDGTTAARYVTGVASNGSGTIRITATTKNLNSSGGIVLDGTGATIPDPNGLGSMSTSGITWLPNLKAFILASTATENDKFPMFASVNGTQWTKITNGITGDYLTMNFIDVSGTTAGSSPAGKKKLILAGTSNYISKKDRSRGAGGGGYQEIDATTGTMDIGSWKVNTSLGTYNFASNTNYVASPLRSRTITGMTLAGDDLYASTRFMGVWRINTRSEYPQWSRE